MLPHRPLDKHFLGLLLLLVGTWTTVSAQFTGPGPTIPNVTTPSGPEQRGLTAARMLIAQQSDSFLGMSVTKYSTFCMDNDPVNCPVGQRVTVACRRAGEVFVVFNTTMIPEGLILPDPSLLLSGPYEDQCSFDKVTECQPAINQYVVGNFTNVEGRIEAAIQQCSPRAPTIIFCTGQGPSNGGAGWANRHMVTPVGIANGGATAALCGYWSSQAFPASQISVVTFASNWTSTMVNCAFVARYGRFVSYTLEIARTAQTLLNSTGIRSSPTWVTKGSDCADSPYCKMNEGVNATCTLLEDLDPNEETQFLLSYPGAVVMYATNTTPIVGGASQVTITQSAAVMWVPESSGLVVVLANSHVNAQTLNPNDYVKMVNLWNAGALGVDPEAFEPYTTSFRAADAPDLPGEFQSAAPMVVESYLNQWSRFANVSSSKLQCTGINGCYQYVSGSGDPQLVICAGYGVAGGVAGVCAVWASLKFPQAKVVWVNAGSPQPVGNADFYNFVNAASGNFYTLVNYLDPVPRSVLCTQNATRMEIPSVTTYYFNQTGLTQAQDPFFNQVNCNYFKLPPAQRQPIADNKCSSYFSEAIEAAIDVVFQLPPQGAFSTLASDANLEVKFWQDPPLGLYGSR